MAHTSWHGKSMQPGWKKHRRSMDEAWNCHGMSMAWNKHANRREEA
jgi:hypothetical protein